MEPTEAVGTDAFLDIVANLVGILLILILVIGVRMDDASEESKQSATRQLAGFAAIDPPALEPLPLDIPDVEPARLEVTALEASIRAVEQESRKLAQLAQLQKLERDQYMLAVTTAEGELARRRATLDESQQQQLKLDLALEDSQDEYQTLADRLESTRLDAAKKTTEVIQHVATPLAKTVFVREEHFRLHEGRLQYVPLNEMTRQLRSEAPKKLWKLKSASQITETIGPYEGFYMRYKLRRNRVPVTTEAGLLVREVVELDRFVMLPVDEQGGEPVEAALSARSELRQRLASWDAKNTVVTIWTYPESFADFRRIKAELYQLGYLSAARPLPSNQPISGSPQGTRSAAQ
jgi:hypothetical protein